MVAFLMGGRVGRFIRAFSSYSYSYPLLLLPLPEHRRQVGGSKSTSRSKRCEKNGRARDAIRRATFEASSNPQHQHPRWLLAEAKKVSAVWSRQSDAQGLWCGLCEDYSPASA